MSVSVFQAPSSLSAVSLSPDATLAVVGGRDVLKVVRIDSGEIIDGFNIRVPSSRSKQNHYAVDVKWHPDPGHTLIATASTNGVIVLWDHSKVRAGHNTAATVNTFKEHSRATNRICWHNTDPALLLSGSQDGLIKIWDIRAGGDHSAMTFEPKSDSVRDVHCDPFNEHLFAAAFENGTVQVWDRRAMASTVRIAAHSGLALSIQYHPNWKNTLASGGRDKRINVWNLEAAEFSKPRECIQTFASIGKVAWRPGYHNQLSSTAHVMDNVVHVWDIRRPFVPLLSFGHHKDVITGYQWVPGRSHGATTSPRGSPDDRASQYLLTVSKDNSVVLHSAESAFRPHEEMPASAIAVSSTQVAWLFDPIDRDMSRSKDIAKRPTGVIRVADELCDPDLASTDFGWNIHSALPGYSPAVVSQLPSMAPFLMDPPFPVFKYLAVNYRLRGAMPTELCRHNAMVADAVGSAELSHLWMALAVICSLPANKPSMAVDYSTRTQHTLSILTEESSSPKTRGVRMFPTSEDTAPTSHAPTDGVSVISHQMPLTSPRDSTMLPALNKANPIGTAGFALQPVVVGARAGYEDVLASSDSDMEYFVESDSDHSVHSRFSGISNMSDKPSAEVLIAPAPLPATSQASDAGVDRPSISTAAASTLAPSGDTLRDVGDGTDAPVDPAAVFVGDVDNHTIALRQQAIVDMLQFYSDRGDVQTCTTVMCVLSGSSLFPEAISEKQHLLWTRGYIDLLHRFHGWGTACTIIARSSLAGVNRMNQETPALHAGAVQALSTHYVVAAFTHQVVVTPLVLMLAVNGCLQAYTSFSTTCPSCRSFDMPAPATCGSCKTAETCALCELPVKGLYAWCQGCGHGGHLEHVRQWFSTESACPTGCGHVCNLSSRHV